VSPPRLGLTHAPGTILEDVSFGLTIEKLLLIGIIAVFLIGPDRLPGYTAQFARLIKSLRDMARGAKDRMRDELGPDFDEVEWRKLDPRQYDPRRIIREARLDDGTQRPAVAPAVAAGAAKPAIESAYQKRQRYLREGKPAPFDPDAT
jgi:sec-independent protein translocase protein TatB